MESFNASGFVQWSEVLQRSFAAAVQGEFDASPEQLPAGNAFASDAVPISDLVSALASRIAKARSSVDVGYHCDRVHVASFAQAATSYLSVLLPQAAHIPFSREVALQTGSWCLELLGYIFKDVAVLFEADSFSARLTAMHTATRTKEQPVIYTLASTAAYYDTINICETIGLSANHVSILSALDASTLQTAIRRDRESGRTPCMVLAGVGLAEFGLSDDLISLRSVCDAEHVWLHVEGPALALLGSESQSENIAAARLADSMTCEIGSWFAQPIATACTVYPRMREPPKPRIPTPLLHLVPLWIYLQSCGRKALSRALSCSASNVAQLRTLVQDCSDVAVKVLPDTGDHVLIFRCSPRPHHDSDIELTDLTEIEMDESSEDVLDDLNLQLLRYLRALVSGLGIDVIHIKHAVWLRYNPLIDPLLQPDAPLEAFATMLRKACAAVLAAISVREPFVQAIAGHLNFGLVPATGFVGVSCVRFVPEYLVGPSFDEADESIDQLNTTLARRLFRQHGSVCGVRTAADERPCVCVHVDFDNPLTADRVVALAHEIAEAAEVLERDLKVVDSVSDVLVQARDAALSELERERLDAAQESGVLRRLPWVGGLYNWLVPTEQRQARGRQYDLVAQVLAPAPQRGQQQSGGEQEQ